jgi:uncharacterized membrane protein YeaQ/YmgE (transglycosylase-associated protein family)
MLTLRISDGMPTDGRQVIRVQVFWILVTGIFVGGLARHAIRGREPIPVWLSIACGISGALLGNLISGVAGVRYTGHYNWIRHVIEIAAAVGIVLLISPFWVAHKAKSKPSSRV